MHDIVAHTLSVVIAQADGGRYAAKKDPQAPLVALATISDMARERRIPEESKPMLRRYLEHCDLVKFAKHVPSREEMEKAYSSAKDFIERSAPAPAQDAKEGKT